MSSFFGSSASQSTPSSEMQERKQKIIDNLRSELALAGAQGLINTINNKCFAKCIAKPSSSLSNSEQTCLTNCMERYMEAYNIVSGTYRARLKRESTSEGDLQV